MRNLLLSGVSFICLCACTQSPPVYIGSGDYTFVSPEDQTPLASLAGVSVNVDVDALRLTIAGGDLEYQTTLFELPEDEWMENCPTNFSAVQLETLGLQDVLEIEDEILEEPILFADGCVGSQGETATQLWLSSVAFQDASSSIGEGRYLLERN